MTFYKYHGAGNDFILFDNRNAVLPRQHPLFYASLCHRRFGIGADGVMLLQNHAQGDFEMATRGVCAATAAGVWSHLPIY
ncbi:MAG TPA: hypothetical protein PKD56_03495 [Chitinophagales bacterium]|nr:hypothetical protein [Chitinophagales bacterium]